VLGWVPMTFGALLRRLRTDAGLTQEELAEAAGVSSRSISDLERGINLTPRRDTARLLADALNLVGRARVEFEAAARSRSPIGDRATSAGVRTLPRDVTGFAGREPEMRALAGAVTEAATGGVIGINAIGGMAGIGKTAFAVHAAHLFSSQFPDGQIFLQLHGHTPGHQPVDPSDALASLLLTIGVAPQQIPPGLEARSSVWRDQQANKQFLLVLDDAASSDQVRPLLPGIGGSLVLITSRRHLSALEGATSISLDTLPPDEAVALLVRLAARPGLDPGDVAVSEIVRLCGYLPLAIGMLARQLHHHPAWSLTGLAADMATARDRLELMATENLSVAAAFDLSYQDLTQSQKRMFRLLGLHPGPDITAYAAAALGDTDLGTARRHLEALYDQYLLTEPARGRYRLHDLIREHARSLAIREDPVDSQEQAISRVLDYYQYVARIAGHRLARYAQSSPIIHVASPATIPDLRNSADALSWMRAERANLRSCLDHCMLAGQPARVVALTSALAALLRRDGPWTEAIARHTAAVRAARDSSDRLDEADALNSLVLQQRAVIGVVA
jgi:transcriptional regulator with XRE-family HTH domain